MKIRVGQYFALGEPLLKSLSPFEIRKIFSTDFERK